MFNQKSELFKIWLNLGCNTTSGTELSTNGPKMFLTVTETVSEKYETVV